VNRCAPAEAADPGPVRVTGLAITSVSAAPGTVFTKIEVPPARFARIGPVTNVIESWRGKAMLDQSFAATRLGWPVDVTLLPGKVLDAAVGLEPWRAELATEGLVLREPYFVEAVSGILAEVNGFVMVLPAGQRTLIVSEDYYPEVAIGEPIPFSELGEAILLEIDHPATEPPTTSPSGEGEDGEDEGMLEA
jgi:hypothetical protein